MAEKYNASNIALEQILNYIKSGEIAIPEIQRPFVWKPRQVKDLIDSLYTGYPTGYLIISQSPNIKLKDGTLAEGKKIINERLRFIQIAHRWSYRFHERIYFYQFCACYQVCRIYIVGSDSILLWFPSQNRMFLVRKPYGFGTENVRFWNGKRKRKIA